LTASSTLSIRVSPETREGLEKLALSTRRSKSFLAAEAIDRYLARELEIMEGIERGLEDMRAGRLIPHEEAMARIDATIAAATKKRNAR
jgi:predicted transcriptional regulator